MDALRARVETWIRDQRERLTPLVWAPTPPPRWRWPPWRSDAKEEREEIEIRRRQLRDLCRAVKAESAEDLQDVLCSMILSESVYKRPSAEMIRAINKFKADFGGQVVLERVQPSLDHVPHRYLLAEAGDTLYASFIGTKQYKDIMADANILQGVIFHDDAAEDDNPSEVTSSDSIESNEKLAKPTRLAAKKNKSKPAAHRGFLARAKGIPALELYKLAQKKNRKLVLCGHSLGGAVAALATLAILRVIASSSNKEHDKIPIKCITFSQPPVGNAALRDYVHRKGWHHFFRTYCIPEDLVPRILSPAYFHHYNAQPLPASAAVRLDSSSDGQLNNKSLPMKYKDSDNEQLVLGLGPVQTSFWRLSKLVPLEAVQKQLNKFKGEKQESEGGCVPVQTDAMLKADNMESEPQSLEIQENSDGISLAPLHIESEKTQKEDKEVPTEQKNFSRGPNSGKWPGVPYFPSYVPFGQLYLLGNLSVDFLSDAEYSKLTSVRSVISELRERLQSHSMRSYRARFQKMYDMSMSIPATFLGLEQSTQFPHLQQWLGLAAAGDVELGNIVEAPDIQAAISIVPLDWSGLLDKKSKPFKVDILGSGLHLCSLIQAQVNGNWCSTSVESFPPAPPYSMDCDIQLGLQKMRILVGSPLRRPPRHGVATDTLMPLYPSNTEETIADQELEEKLADEKRTTCSEGLNGFTIFCTSDFITISKEVFVRTRRVQLLGLEGAGKTSLFTAMLGQSSDANVFNLDLLHPHTDGQHGVVGGVCYSDRRGVNLQELQVEVNRFREELHSGLHDLDSRTDLIVLVHNLSHKIPQFYRNNSEAQPALSLLLSEAEVLRIPWVLAITNKYSVSADQQKPLVNSVMEAYQASSNMTEVINSCPYVIPSSEMSIENKGSADSADLSRTVAAQSLFLAPINFMRMPFQKRNVMPVDGVVSLRKIVHSVLRSQEETSFQQLAEERLSQELTRKRLMAMDGATSPPSKGSSAAAAAVGASIGAGVGVLFALVMGAASALRKP